MTQDAADASKPVVTLWETYGAGMREIGQRVAERLKVPLHDPAATPEGDEPHEHEGALTRLLGAYQRYADVTADPAQTLATLQAGDHERSVEVTALVKELAVGGGVILGLDAAVILAGRPNTVTVKLDGPVFERIRYAAVHEAVEEPTAARRQRLEDAVRPQLSRAFHNYDPLDNDAFDLVLNTSLLSTEACARIICDALRAKSDAPRP